MRFEYDGDTLSLQDLLDSSYFNYSQMRSFLECFFTYFPDHRVVSTGQAFAENLPNRVFENDTFYLFTDRESGEAYVSFFSEHKTHLKWRYINSITGLLPDAVQEVPGGYLSDAVVPETYVNKLHLPTIRIDRAEIFDPAGSVIASVRFRMESSNENMQSHAQVFVHTSSMSNEVHQEILHHIEKNMLPVHTGWTGYSHRSLRGFTDLRFTKKDLPEEIRNQIIEELTASPNAYGESSSSLSRYWQPINKRDVVDGVLLLRDSTSNKFKYAKKRMRSFCEKYAHMNIFSLAARSVYPLYSTALSLCNESGNTAFGEPVSPQYLTCGMALLLAISTRHLALHRGYLSSESKFDHQLRSLEQDQLFDHYVPLLARHFVYRPPNIAQKKPKYVDMMRRFDQGLTYVVN